jgi:Fur family transcriptional regulator, ferric uptake regulator
MQTEIAEKLREQGFRSTGPRRAVLDAAERRGGRFTAEDIYAELRPAGIGRATVFRTLDLLAERGHLERIHSDKHCSTYTVCGPGHHHHLVCIRCADVVEITTDSAERAVRAIAREAGYELQSHLLEIRGVCRRCQAAAAGQPAVAKR